MAHQAHNIPWNLLASNLRWVSASSCNCGVTNLHPRMRPNQGKELTYFIEAFIRNIDEHSACERRKYPDYGPPDPTDVILNEAIVQKISPTVQRWRSYNSRVDYTCGGIVCQAGGECQCPIIPYEDRKVYSFLREYTISPCYRFFEFNKEGFFNLELVKTLILYGEMDPILHVCAHPQVGLRSWWSKRQCYDVEADLGWDQLCKRALGAYIGLNVGYCFPEMWDESSGKTEEMDCRQTKFYQYMLRECTAYGKTTDVVTYPHRQFFGIGNDQLSSYPKVKDRQKWLRWDPHITDQQGYVRNFPYGKISIDELLTLELRTSEKSEYQPDTPDVHLVRWMLCSKGLPVELSMDIMELAKYEPKRRLQKPHDPLHPSNREELAQYLKYCWQLLVRCDMMAKALDMKIPWQELVSNCIVNFWGSKQCGLRTWYKVKDYLDYSYEFI